MQVAIIQYNAGNVTSVSYALERLGVQPILTDKAELIKKADKVIFPGVGEASTAMQYLKSKGLDKLIPQLKQPFLGICLGMQLMCRYSEEGQVSCLGIFHEGVKLFRNEHCPQNKIPHIGWNNLSQLKGNLFKGIAEQSEVYFVHSYYVEKSPFCIAETDYALAFSAALQKQNFYATQFHPEKSANIGEQILKNFLALKA